MSAAAPPRRPAAPLRLLHVIGGLGLGGAERQLVALVRALPEHRHVVCALGGPTALAAPLRAAGAELHQGGAAGLGALWRALGGAPPDLLHGWTYVGGVAARLAQAALRAGGSTPPLVVATHNAAPSLPLYRRRTRLWGAACGHAARAAAAVTCVAASALSAHTWPGAPPPRLLPGGVDLRAFAPRPGAAAALRAALGLAARTPLVLHVGRPDPLKDHATLLRAAALAAPSGLHLLLVGPPSPALRAAAAALPNVHVLGARADVRPLMQGCDLLALTSRSEACPQVVLEALACGLPCAVTDVGDCAALVGDCGLVAPPGQPHAIALSWRRLLALPAAERRALGGRGRARVAQRHSLAAMAGRWAALYAELAGGGRSGRGRAGRGRRP